MWCGAAPKRPFNVNRFHGRWRWFYDYGTGDLGNDGVHRIDMAVAGLQAAIEAQKEDPLGLPTGISASGRHPRILTYEMRVWCPYQYLGESEGAAVFGENGYIVLGNRRWRAYDRSG